MYYCQHHSGMPVKALVNMQFEAAAAATCQHTVQHRHDPVWSVTPTHSRRTKHASRYMHVPTCMHGSRALATHDAVQCFLCTASWVEPCCCATRVPQHCDSARDTVRHGAFPRACWLIPTTSRQPIAFERLYCAVGGCAATAADPCTFHDNTRLLLPLLLQVRWNIYRC
jgi:hypothetical protein